MTGSRVREVLDIPAELVFPGIEFVGTVGHATLPVRSRSAAAVSIIICIDSMTVDGQSCSTAERPFFVTRQSFQLNAASCHDVQVLSLWSIVSNTQS